MPKQRLTYVDDFKGWCMFFVILSHCRATSEWMAFLQPFFLTGFFFISGYFFVNFEKKSSAVQKFLNILTSILLPYILYWILSSTVNMILNDNFSVYGLIIDILSGRKLWFASALFVTECVSFLCIYIPSLYIRQKIIISVVLIIVSLSFLLFFFSLSDDDYIWYWRAMLFAEFYFCIGVFAKLWNDYYVKLLKSTILLTSSSILYLIMFIIDVFFINNEGSFHKEYSNYPFFIVESLMGVYVFLCVFYRLTIKAIKVPILGFIGANSLLFYFFQHQIILFIHSIFLKLGISLHEALCPLIYAVLVIMILYPIVYMVSKYLPIVAGKYRIIYNVENK